MGGSSANLLQLALGVLGLEDSDWQFCLHSADLASLHLPGRGRAPLYS